MCVCWRINCVKTDMSFVSQGLSRPRLQRYAVSLRVLSDVSKYRSAFLIRVILRLMTKALSPFAT